MTSFLDLPNDLLALVVTDWLCWKDVGKLDSAICSKDKRNRWLDLLKRDCIFRCVIVDYHRDLDLPNNLQWCIARQIRTHIFSFVVESIVEKDYETVLSWLNNTEPLITTVCAYSKSGLPINAATQEFRHLRILCVIYCMIDHSFWELVRNNPNLEELHVLQHKTQSIFVGPVPTNLSLSRLKKLQFELRLISSADIITLFQQLPALERLKYNGLDLYDYLPDLCSKIVHLDLKYAHHQDWNNDRFFNLMSSLKSGLRCLVLPAIHGFTIRELQSIAQYHSHSLVCLSIPGRHYLAEDPADMYNLVDLINSLQHLHTLSMRARSFNLLTHKKITNPTITHLMLDFRFACTASMCELANHCPAVTMLSIIQFSHASVVNDITNLLQLRPLIQTICVDREEVILQLREALPTITVRKCIAIDIFEQEY